MNSSHKRDRLTIPSWLEDRLWQERGIADYFAKEKESYLANVTPGGGKTIFGLRIFQRHYERQEIDFVIVVAPYENLKTQWVEDAAPFGIQLTTGHEIRDNIREQSIRFAMEDFHGIVTSYQQVAYGSYSEVFRKFCSEYRVFVIFDEPHHCGDGTSWGKAIEHAFEHAYRRLFITGTAYRSDEKIIPYITYETSIDDKGIESYRPLPDFTYSYGEALNERNNKVVRPVAFPKYDGEIEWIEKIAKEVEGGVVWDESQSKKMNLDEEASIRDQRIRLNVALDPRGGWVRSVIKAANKKLNELRQYEQSDAGGLVVCRDITHLKEMIEIMNDITGEYPFTVTNEDANTSDIIKNFKRSGKKWILAVKVFSEGVSVKRLRVGVYATNICTRLFFTQVMGRFVRIQTDDHIEPGPQYAYFYVPKTEPFLTYIKEITDIVNEWRKKKEPGEGPGPGKRSIAIEYGDTLGWEDGIEIAGGKEYSSKDVAILNRALEAKGLLGRVTAMEALEILDFLRLDLTTFVIEEETSDSKAPLGVFDTNRKKKNNEINNLVARLVHSARDNCGVELQHGLVHGSWKNATGYDAQTAPWEKLLEKEDWVKRLISLADNGDFREDLLWIR